MTASLWLVAGLACAVRPASGPAPEDPAQDVRRPHEDAPPPEPSASKITEVTVYQGQALVTREVSVPEGEGTVELVVTPLPAQVVDSSLYTEGTDGLRVLSTRFRSRAVKEDTRQEVRAKEEQIKKLRADAQRLQNEVAVQEQDLQYLGKLEGFTGTALTGLTEKGRLDSEAILTLSKFVMESRGDEVGRRDRPPPAVAGQRRGGRVRRAAAQGAVRRVEPDRARRRDRRAEGRSRGGHGAARLPRRLRDLDAAIPPPGHRRQRTRPARVPRRRDPAVGRGLAGRPRHALHLPALARRRAPRAPPAEDGRRRRRGLRPDRGEGREFAGGSSPSWRRRSTCRSRTRPRWRTCSGTSGRAPGARPTPRASRSMSTPSGCKRRRRPPPLPWPST